MAQKFDETIPGGLYGNTDGNGFHDAWGNPIVVESDKDDAKPEEKTEDQDGVDTETDVEVVTDDEAEEDE